MGPEVIPRSVMFPAMAVALVLALAAVHYCASLASGAERLAGPVQATVVRVVDGDTLEVEAAIWLGLRQRVFIRLAGIDTPELLGQCANERNSAIAAKALLASKVGVTVVLIEIAHDKFAGRVLAKAKNAAGEDLSAILISAGLARPYNGGPRRSWCP